MKNLSRHFIALILLSCSVNDPTGIEEIISRGNYKIECNYQGCFGGGTQILEVNGLDHAEYTFSSGSRREKRKIAWNAKKDSLVLIFFRTGVTFNDTVGSCTTTSSYKLKSLNNVVEFDDLNCEMDDIFTALIE